MKFHDGRQSGLKITRSYELWPRETVPIKLDNLFSFPAREI